jgi:hypothetical protein
LKFDQPLIPGKLIKRYKRFLADVELDSGEIITAHCPNTGSMKTCDTPGWKVMLSYHENPKRIIEDEEVISKILKLPDRVNRGWKPLPQSIITNMNLQSFFFDQTVCFSGQRLGRTMNPVGRASVPAGFSSSRTPEYGRH